MPVPAVISQLVELFERNYDQYRAPTFTEAAVRHQFIDAFFAALGSQTAAGIDLHARLAAEGVPHEKAALQRRIEMTDRQIDAQVYELYGLTEEEIKLVEGE
jgi:hypothetical protein